MPSDCRKFKRSPVSNPKLLRPGEYMTVLNQETWTKYKCPSCGFVTSLSRAAHDINYDGLVSPGVTCPHKTGSGNPCKFSELVSLEDWVPEAKGSA